MAPDSFALPNRLVATASDPESDVDPYTAVRDDGRPLRTQVEEFDVADADALAAVAEERLSDLRQVERRLELAVSPNPLHSHRDVVRVIHDDLDVDSKALVEQWSIDLAGGDMTLTARLL